MTTFTKTLPTEPGWYYWRLDERMKWILVEVLEGIERDSFFVRGACTHSPMKLSDVGGEWGGRVPAPGTTWTVEEIEKYFIGGNFSETADDKFAKLRDPQTGLAATTERNRKE